MSLKMLKGLLSYSSKSSEKEVTKDARDAVKIGFRRMELKWNPKDGSNDIVPAPTFETTNDLGLSSKWQFYLKWKKCQNGKDYLGIFLHAAPQMPEQGGKVRMLSLNAQFDANLVHPTFPQKNIKISTTANDFMVKRSWGIQCLVSREDLQNFIDKDGNAKIVFDFFLVDQGPQSNDDDDEKRKKLEKSISACITDVFTEIQKDTHKDITLKSSDGKHYKAHGVVLAARSKFFRAVLEEMREASFGSPLERLGADPSFIEVDQPSSILSIILCHIYFAHLEPEWLNPDHVPIKMAKDLVEAAELHGLICLKNYLLDYYPGLEGCMNQQNEN